MSGLRDRRGRIVGQRHDGELRVHGRCGGEDTGVAHEQILEAVDTERRVHDTLRGVAAQRVTALRLAAYFGTEPQFWMNLQQAYDLKMTEAAKGATIRKQVRPRAA